MNSTQLPEGYSEFKSIDLATNKSEMLTVNFAALLLGAVMVVPAALLMPFPKIFDNFIQHLPVVLFFLASLIIYIFARSHSWCIYEAVQQSETFLRIERNNVCLCGQHCIFR